MLSQHTHNQIFALSSLYQRLMDDPFDAEGLLQKVSHEADALLSSKVKDLADHENPAVFGWLEHQALQATINRWLDGLDIDGLGNKHSSHEQQTAFIQGLIELGLPESALTCIGRGQQRKHHDAGTLLRLELLRGKAMAAMGHPEAAIECFQHVAELQPDNHTPYFYLASEYLRLGRHANALDAFEQVIALKPELPGPWHNKGVCLYQLEAFDDAIPHFKKATELAPRFIGSWITLAKCYLALGDHQQALSAFNVAEKLERPHPELHKGLGLVYKQLGRLDLAASHLHQALEMMPEEVGLYLAHAECQLAVGQWQLALDDISRLKAIEPYNPVSAAIEFKALYRLGRYAEAERCFYFLQGMDPQAAAALSDEIEDIQAQIRIPVSEPTQSEAL